MEVSKVETSSSSSSKTMTDSGCSSTSTTTVIKKETTTTTTSKQVSNVKVTKTQGQTQVTKTEGGQQMVTKTEGPKVPKEKSQTELMWEVTAKMARAGSDNKKKPRGLRTLIAVDKFEWTVQAFECEL